MTAQPYDDPDDETRVVRHYLTAADRYLRPGGSADADELDELGIVLPPADVHPLDDPSCDLDVLLAWFVDLPSTVRPCALDHWVADVYGRRRIGAVRIDPAAAPAAAAAADPQVFVLWARCKVCYWPVWTLTYTDPTPPDRPGDSPPGRLPPGLRMGGHRGRRRRVAAADPRPRPRRRRTLAAALTPPRHYVPSRSRRNR